MNTAKDGVAMSLDLEAIKRAVYESEMDTEEILDLINEAERLSAPPRGYPECTSAIIEAMDKPSGEILIRKMHADENLIESLRSQLAAANERAEVAIVAGARNVGIDAGRMGFVTTNSENRAEFLAQAGLEES